MAGRTYKTEAIVLRSMRFSEADRILHLYTADRGRIGAIAGPLVTAPLLAAGVAFPWGFFLFAAVAAVGAAGVAAAGRTTA